MVDYTAEIKTQMHNNPSAKLEVTGHENLLLDNCNETISRQRLQSYTLVSLQHSRSQSQDFRRNYSLLPDSDISKF